MSLSGSGSYGKTVPGLNGHPWYPPEVAKGDTFAEGKLLMRNTFTGKKDVFIPMKGREVRWYTCGPTVYDSSHVGHARSYLTFDIMRRIMSDYFGYDVLYQINITDIDDKIILRARQNELLKRLQNDQSVDFESLCKLVDIAVEEMRVSMTEKLKDLESKIQRAKEEKDNRTLTEAEELLKMQKQKEENFVNEVALIKEAKTTKDRSELIRVAKSALAAKLDKEKGSSITEHEVFNAHARKYEREYMEDMEALGIREPDVLTRVTEYIPQIISFIEKIIGKGLAYASSEGSVYLSLDNYTKEHNYRKLSVGTVDASEAELAESEGALGDTKGTEKRNNSDFALWKASKAGEPAWDSPWGKGRPGWHIECSVIASDILGECLDIHSGGEDLKFPHHDNELAQSEACFGSQQWVNYFTHAGHLHIKGLKMSKSLKNFITIRQALEKHSARQLRILFLLQPWDDQMNFSDQTVDDAKSKEKTFRTFFQEVEALSRKDYLLEPVGWRMGKRDRDLSDNFLKTQAGVHRALLDNFNTKEAMLQMLGIISEVNIYLRVPDTIPPVLLLRRIATYITRILKVFGVIQGADDFGFSGGSGGGAAGAQSKEQIVTPYMDAFAQFREKVRSAALGAPDKQSPAIKAILDACDFVRDETLVGCGIRLEDRPDGSKWNMEDPAVLLAEKLAKLEEEKEAKKAKLRKKIAAKQKELDKMVAAKVPPNELFKTSEFSSWDENGVPTKMADGKDVSGAQKKKTKKLMDKQTKAHEDLLKKSGGDIDKFIAAIEEEMQQLSLEQ